MWGLYLAWRNTWGHSSCCKPAVRVTCVWKLRGDILTNFCVEFTCSPLGYLLNSSPRAAFKEGPWVLGLPPTGGLPPNHSISLFFQWPSTRRCFWQLFSSYVVNFWGFTPRPTRALPWAPASAPCPSFLNPPLPIIRLGPRPPTT